MRDMAEALNKTGLEIMDVGPRSSEVYNKKGECVFTGSSRSACMYVINSAMLIDVPQND